MPKCMLLYELHTITHSDQSVRYYIFGTGTSANNVANNMPIGQNECLYEHFHHHTKFTGLLIGMQLLT